MNDVAIKNFCVTARRDLRDQVKARLIEWDVSENADPNRNVIGDVPLSTAQMAQRRTLLRLCKTEGEEQLVERAAYTWFNRLMAIRYMEVNDYLPCHCRVLSGNDGSFDPQILKDVLTVEVEGVDRNELLKLLQANDDEALFRYLFLAVCNDLAACMPDVFEPIGSAMELLLPKAMLHKGSVAARMVTDIPEEDWREGVQIVGWMYQYYVSERKDEVFAGFKNGKKAERYDIAPATQLFTPDWIVKYLVQNSLGRLWMLNRPQSPLASRMEYYIAPGEDAETEFLHVGSPEGLTVCDPACGSGHILVYAFDLLALMYEEAGYVRRDIPRAILENNLTGFEIDPRAAAIASFCLTMKGMEYDSRFLRRDVKPRVNLLESIEFTEEETAGVPALADDPVLVDTLAHLSECGTLFKPTIENFQTLDMALLQLGTASDLFMESLVTKLGQAVTTCADLNETYAIVVANPPYMGSSNMNKWLANWTKKNYPDSKRDLCTCFIERSFSLVAPNGYEALITMQSWMFLGSFEALREKIIEDAAIVSMAHLGPRAFDTIGGEVVSTTAAVLQNRANSAEAEYVRLVDYDGEAEKQQAVREAIANPDCGWFYRRSAETFKSIPGTPIAYWASDAIVDGFCKGERLDFHARPLQGMATGDNDRFLRTWWEVDYSGISFCSLHEEAFTLGGYRYVPHNKGGDYRRWYGNLEYILRFSPKNRKTLESMGNHLPSRSNYFKRGISYSDLTSGLYSARYSMVNATFDATGPMLFPDKINLHYLLGYLNSVVFQAYCSLKCQGLHYNNGILAELPVIWSEKAEVLINELTHKAVSASKHDWDAVETSWDFKKSPLI